MNSRDFVWVFEDTPLTEGTRTFASNLEFLLKTTGTRNGSFCEHFGISRTQFSRLISGKTHPKPHIVAGLQELFNVDARVLTHKIKATEATGQSCYDAFSEFLNSQNFFTDSDQPRGFMQPTERDLPDGLYNFWFQRVFVPGELYRTIAQVKTTGGIKSIELRDFRGDWVHLPDMPGPLKRHVGICFRQPEGFSALHFLPGSDVNLYSSYRRSSWLRPDRLIGIGLWSFSSDSVNRHVQKLAIEKLPRDLRIAKASIRKIGVCMPEALPEFAKEHFGES